MVYPMFHFPRNEGKNPLAGRGFMLFPWLSLPRGSLFPLTDSFHARDIRRRRPAVTVMDAESQRGGDNMKEEDKTYAWRLSAPENPAGREEAETGIFRAKPARCGDHLGVMTRPSRRDDLTISARWSNHLAEMMTLKGLFRWSVRHKHMEKQPAREQQRGGKTVSSCLSVIYKKRPKLANFGLAHDPLQKNAVTRAEKCQIIQQGGIS